MNLDINNLSAVIGVLGAYFAILLVLSVSVESILEPFSFFKGLQKQASPDDVLKVVEEWLPEGSGEAAKVVAIQTFAEKTNTNMEEINKIAKEVSASAIKTLTELGYEEQVNAAQKEIAIKFSTLREQYASSQKRRITLLRFLSAVIGIIIAFALQLNSFEILGSLFSAEIMRSLSTPVGQYGGIILTGLAASAGSSFWHDMIGRARNIKDTIKQVEVMTGGNNS
ncbi:MAG: hypothetical protein IPP66_05370 [Anaerolineales bacterium]|nr:hypothetical protein [Anaerolineales bacterium]